MPKLALRAEPDKAATKFSMLLHQEFDKEEKFYEPKGLLFFLTDGLQHFTLR